ncbi:MAG: hypothetical protein MK105_13650 [Crocinitomicaceae bacterium]|nr:hypothetical protein [Crocinitomicaceae bacterium]
MRRILPALILLALFACSKSETDKKGFQVREVSENEEGERIVGLPIDSLTLETKPRNVLLTNNPSHRVVPIYKVNYDKKTGKPFTGSNRFHSNYWEYGKNEDNNWNNNFMPGFEAVYGYNFVNISHYNNSMKKENLFFSTPVLIKTFYYPAFSKDTLNSIAVNRDYYLVSVYDDDTNNDGYINVKDLRRFYQFDIDALEKTLLIPDNYSVMSSEYDPENDYMYIFARKDENENGQMEYEESTHIFWIDLNNPRNRGIQYGNE